MSSTVSQVRQNYHQDTEAGVNKQINLELHASYVYEQLAWYFNRDDIALEGFHGFFKSRADEERSHARKFMDYQNKRGGRIVLQDIARPVKQDGWTPQSAIEASLDLEKTVNQSLLDLQAIGARTNDAEFTDFIESEFLHEQVDDIKKLGDHLTNLKRVGTGLGEYLFDKQTLG